VKPRQKKPIDMFEGETGYRPPEALLEADEADHAGGLDFPELDLADFGVELEDQGDEGAVRATEQLDLDPHELLGKPRRILDDDRGVAAEHAETLAKTLHEYGPGVTRCVLRGSFVFGDLIMDAAALIGPCKARIVTLSYSAENVDALWTAFQEGSITDLDFITSDFFYAHYRHTLWRMLVTNLPRERCRYAVCGTHAKVALLEPTDASRPSWCIEGSANLRSCQAIEQITVSVDDPEAHRFHGKWIDRILERFNVHRANLGKVGAWSAVAGV